MSSIATSRTNVTIWSVSVYVSPAAATKQTMPKTSGRRAEGLAQREVVRHLDVDEEQDRDPHHAPRVDGESSTTSRSGSSTWLRRDGDRLGHQVRPQRVACRNDDISEEPFPFEDRRHAVAADAKEHPRQAKDARSPAESSRPGVDVRDLIAGKHDVARCAAPNASTTKTSAVTTDCP